MQTAIIYALIAIAWLGVGYLVCVRVGPAIHFGNPSDEDEWEEQE
jgi:hypothetical protein